MMDNIHGFLYNAVVWPTLELCCYTTQLHVYTACEQRNITVPRVRLELYHQCFPLNLNLYDFEQHAVCNTNSQYVHLNLFVNHFTGTAIEGE
jgi:ribonuclease I